MSEGSQSLFSRVKDRFIPRKKIEPAIKPVDTSPVDWQNINKFYAERNKADLEARKTAIEQKGLKDYYKGDFMGMQVFEGKVAISDERQPNKLSEVNVRMIVGRDINDFSSSVNRQHVDMGSEINDNLFATLYFSAQTKVTFGIRGIFTERVKPGTPQYDVNESFGKIIDQYKKNDQGSGQHPLTLVYAHGDLDKSGRHMMNAGSTEVYPTSLVLDKLYEKYPPPPGEKLPVILTSCNEREAESAEIKHQNMMLLYVEGTAGNVMATGYFKLSE